MGEPLRPTASLEVKYTPGPWTITGRKDRDWLFAEIVSEGAGLMVAEIRGATFIDGIEHAEHSANARLIAAAPEMLEALKLIQRDLNIPGLPFCTMSAALAVGLAIAKAEGQANEVS